MENRALGKGLSALIPEKNLSPNVDSVVCVKLSEIKENSLQPRTVYDDNFSKGLKLIDRTVDTMTFHRYYYF